MTERVTFSTLIGQTFALIVSDLGVALLSFIGIVAASTLLDIAMPNGGNWFALPVTIAQYGVTRRLIDRRNLRSADSQAGFGSFFVLGIITGLPILIGYAALIIPGLYLSARWAMADAALLAENGGSTGAARRSWAASAGHILPIALTQLVLAIPLVVGLLLTFGIGFSDGAAAAAGNDGLLTDNGTQYGLDFAINALLYASQIAGWYFGVAAYETVVGRPTAALNEIFE